MELYISYNNICIHSYRSEEEYGDWYEEKEFYVTNVNLTDPENYKNDKITVNFDVEVGDTVYVLSMTYKSGDSFGSSSGNGEIIWVFKDKQIAEQAKQIWEDSGNDIFQISFKIETGEIIQLYNPASGYFERIENINLQPFLVEQ